jgi:hypothetical protein
MSLNFQSTTGLEGLGSYNGSMQWSYAGGAATRGFLTVSITNTSSIAGFLTAFAFNGPSTGFTYGLQTPSAPGEFFQRIGGGANPAGSISASPWSNYLVGASTSNSWLGGGNPNRGLAVGETGSFTFTVDATASALATLDVLSFWSANGNSPAFAARFRGFANGGSDKVGATQTPQDLTVVPIPAPVALAGLGLIGAVLARRRMAKA